MLRGMVAAVRQFVTVEPGGVVRVQSPELREGDVAEVVVLTGSPVSAPNAVARDAPGATWSSFIGSGASTGRTAAEIDAYIRELRDEWDR